MILRFIWTREVNEGGGRGGGDGERGEKHLTVLRTNIKILRPK